MNISSAQIDAVQSQFPTVEAMAAWACLLLHRGNPTLKVLEAENYSDFAAQASVFMANDGSERLVVRLSIPLEPGWASSGDPLWQQVQELSETAIPAGFV